MNILLGTYLNLPHLTIFNANLQFYQLNNCNCFGDITKLFCFALMLVKVNYFYSLSRQIGLPTNGLVDKFVLSNCLPPNCLASRKTAYPFHSKRT